MVSTAKVVARTGLVGNNTPARVTFNKTDFQFGAPLGTVAETRGISLKVVDMLFSFLGSGLGSGLGRNSLKGGLGGFGEDLCTFLQRRGCGACPALGGPASDNIDTNKLPYPDNAHLHRSLMMSCYRAQAGVGDDGLDSRAPLNVKDTTECDFQSLFAHPWCAPQHSAEV